MYNTFKGKENLFSQATFSLASLLSLFCIDSCLLFSISPIVPYPHDTLVCAKQPDINQNTYYLHTLLAVVRLFPFHFTNPFGSTPFLFAPYFFQAHSFDVGEFPSDKPLFQACSTLKRTAAT